MTDAIACMAHWILTGKFAPELWAELWDCHSPIFAGTFAQYTTPVDASAQATMNAIIILIDQVTNLYIYTLLAYIVIGWLIAFKIVNPWQPAVRMINTVLARLHEPILMQIRRFLPDLGGIDISPIVVLFAVQFIRNLLIGMLAGGY